MHDVHIINKPVATSAEKVREPSEVRITLFVCGCYSQERVVFIPASAARVAEILGITIQDLECTAVNSIFSGKPQVVACYKQRDMAEVKLAQLRAHTPFIARSCHSFSIAEDR